MFRGLRRWIPRAACGLAALACAACNQMAQQASVSPYELPEQTPSSGTVAVTDAPPLVLVAATTDLTNPLPITTATLDAGYRNYRSFCHPCHGPRLDGHSLVGPSFPEGHLSLLAPNIVAMTDEQLFLSTWYGAGKNPPFRGTMTPGEVWQVIAYIRSVQANPPPGAIPQGLPGRIDTKSLSQ